ncbi:hypothetical protein ACVWW2_000137 [Bradyrhizobium sp. LM4.3]
MKQGIESYRKLTPALLLAPMLLLLAAFFVARAVGTAAS